VRYYGLLRIATRRDRNSPETNHDIEPEQDFVVEDSIRLNRTSARSSQRAPQRLDAPAARQTDESPRMLGGFAWLDDRCSLAREVHCHTVRAQSERPTEPVVQNNEHRK
jgi:hypothetical protein